MSAQQESKVILTPEMAELKGVLQRAQQGDLTVLPQLKAYLDSKPELWEQVGDLAAHAEMILLRLASGGNLFAQEAMQLKIKELKEELSTPSQTQLERLLVNRIALSWIQVHHADMEASSGMGKTNTPQGVYAQRRLDSAHRRYLYAIRQLATVRKLQKSSGKGSIKVSAKLSNKE